MRLANPHKTFLKSVFKEFRLFRSRQKLKSIKTVFCNTGNLRKLSRDELSGFFSLGKLDEEWGRVSQVVNKLRLPEFTFGVNPGDQRALFYLAKVLNAGSILEIGTHIGCSTVHLALGLSQDPKMLVSVDIRDVNDPVREPWKEYNSLASPEKLLESIGCNDKVEFVTEDSVSFLSGSIEKFDFIFLDGDHSPEKVYEEIPRALKLLNPDGLILLHDYFPENKPLWPDGATVSGPYLAVKRLMKENPNIGILPLGELPWPTKLGSHKTSLALLVKKS